MPTERLRACLRDIVTNGERIQRHVAGYDGNAFVADEKTVDSVERCFQRITEAAIKLDDAAGATTNHISRDEIRALRNFGNKLRHQYHAIAPDQLWRYVIHELPPLIAAAQSELAALSDSDHLGPDDGSNSERS
jgi:uncharacterized protein with HEPN domain